MGLALDRHALALEAPNIAGLALAQAGVLATDAVDTEVRAAREAVLACVARVTNGVAYRAVTPVTREAIAGHVAFVETGRGSTDEGIAGRRYLLRADRGHAVARRLDPLGAVGAEWLGALGPSSNEDVRRARRNTT
jgi:hypothetical protein